MASFRRVQRGPELQAKLTKLRKGVDPAAEAGLLKAGAIISAEQKRLAPVDTGALRDSIRYFLSRSSRSGNNAVRVIADSEYGLAIEFGRRGKSGKRVGARPFFLTGFRATRGIARAAIAKAIRDNIKASVS